MVDWERFYKNFREPGFLPGYEILHHLGGGAFGEVYQAKKVSIGKLYAIKFLKLDDETASRAIERELEQVRHFAAIDHPNLVTIEDMGVIEDVPYLIMGYAGEDTLAGRIRRRDLSQELALRLFHQICQGVMALHNRRLAHFDLKPSNVFLYGEVARVGDYGLAKLLAEGQQTLSVGRGTPQYMAPEMMKRKADERADIYALGLILFECFAFQPAFPRGEWGGVLRENDEPPEFPAGFPSGVKRVITKCVRLDPVDRYQNVGALLADLQPGSATSSSAGATPNESTRAIPSGDPNLEELKGAARELARGAAGVARGVWSGVRDRIEAGARGPEDTQRAKEPSFGDDVVSVSGLDGESKIESSTKVMPPRPPSSAHRPVLFPYGPGAHGATLPVPPKVTGNVIEVAGYGLALGVEIFWDLVSVPLRVAFRSTARTADRLARRLPGVAGRVVRYAAFLLFWAAVGGLTTGIVLAAVTLL